MHAVPQFASEYLLPRNISWIATLGMFNMHIKEPMFQFLACFKFVWLGFKTLKVGQLLFCAFVQLFTIQGSPLRLVITLTPLIWMNKFLLHCVLGVRHFIYSKFEVMKNPFSQFANMIPNAISIVLQVVKCLDWSVPLFDML